MTDYDGSLPPGYRLVPARTTYLEMLRNEVPNEPARPSECSVARWDRPPLDEYRALFLAVGGDWGWSGRLLLSDGELREVLDDPAMEIHRLTCGGLAAGFAELDRSTPGEVEIVYFGLTPDFIGRGLGGFLLRWTIHRAWQGLVAGGESDREPTRRVWLHTCEFDHPSAVAVYQKAGFAAYDEQVEMQPYPEAFLARLGR